MSDMNTQPAVPIAVPAPKRSFFRSRWFMVGALIFTGVAGFGLGKASSFRHFGSWSHMLSERGMDSMRMQSRAEYGINRVLSSVDATVEQKTRISAIVQKTMGEMLPLRQARRDVREKLSAALKSPTIDRAAVENLRSSQLLMAETISKKLQDSLLEAADILSPSQRTQLVDRWQFRRWRG